MICRAVQGGSLGSCQIARLIQQKAIDLAVIPPPAPFSSALMVFLGVCPSVWDIQARAEACCSLERIACNSSSAPASHVLLSPSYRAVRPVILSPPLPSISLNGTQAKWADTFLSQSGLQGKVLVGLNRAPPMVRPSAGRRSVLRN